MLGKIILIVVICFFVLVYFVYRHELTLQFLSNTSEIRPVTQMWGGIDKSMAPDITSPSYVDEKTAATYLKSSDSIYFIRAKDAVYVYPQLIMRYHEVVNDVIDGKPVAVTFCILSNTPHVFNRMMNGKVVSFQSLGPLMYGNQVMYDKETNSYWNELTGVSFYGSLKGIRLQSANQIEMTTWKNIQQFPNLKILKPVYDIRIYWKNEIQNDPRMRMYIGLTSMKSQKSDPRLPANTNGLGIFIHDVAKFYPEKEIVQKRVINDTVGGWGIVIVHNVTLGEQLIFRRCIYGMELTFVPVNNTLMQDEQTHSIWDATGRAVSGILQGLTLRAPVYVSSYWYSWAAFYPHTMYFQ